MSPLYSLLRVFLTQIDFITYWILSNTLSASETIIYFLFFILLNAILYWLICKYWIILASGIYLTWAKCKILLMYYWIQLLIICWRILHLCSLRILALIVFYLTFLVVSLSDFGFQGSDGFTKCVWIVFLFLNFLEEFKEIMIISFLNCFIG